MKRLKNQAVLLTVALACLGLSAALYAQGTLGETVTTMELQQEMRAGEGRPTQPKPEQEANKTEQPSIARFEKVAQKLFYSLQTGRYDRADFSAIWSTQIPPDVNFTDGINALIRPALAPFGRAEKLGEGNIVGPDKAMFLVRFSGGTLNMTFSLDAQDKIGEWLLTPAAPQAAAPARPVPSEQPATPAETQTISPALPEDTNAADVPDINDFNSFQREINRMNIETRSEEQIWLGPLDRKAELARAIDELVDAELRFIRKLAESEDANQTVRAIDLVIRQRRERLNNLTRQLTEEIREERQQQTTERRTRRPARSADGQEPTERTRDRPARRTRETPTEGQP